MYNGETTTRTWPQGFSDTRMLTPLHADRIKVSVLAAPIDEAVAMSFSSLRNRRTCLVEIEADGLIGVGESWINYPPWSHTERLATLAEGVLPHVLGKDISDPEAVYSHLVRALWPVGRQWGAVGPVMQAISAVDLALWDLKGQRLGKSVGALLAEQSPRSKIPAYGSGIGPDDVGNWCESALEQGLSAVKVKLGFGAERDAQGLAEARNAVGESARVFSDANQAWTLEEAQSMLDVLEQNYVGWIEEPLAGDSLAELGALAAAGSVPIATGENIYGTSTFERYVGSGAVAFIQPDLTKSGGITAAMRVAKAAQKHQVEIAPHCYGGAVGIAASLHLASAFPKATWIEWDVRPNPLRSDLLTTELSLNDGALAVPTGPGLGIQLDREVVREHLTHEMEYHNDR